ncbi:MAG: prepilin-type N-terminal cleavage/methylation domain-containing protein [Deltaproteobacteria bacterium]|nr:prepilin-type N-terminal cleavage/methylation domain-containing protein [Deltaproteobacteria bacterium]
MKFKSTRSRATMPRPLLRRRRGILPQAGFSLVEGLVAMAILLIIVLGLIPLFTQSMVNNVAGRHLTMASNFAADFFEDRVQKPFNNEDITMDVGSRGLSTIELFAGRAPEDASGDPLPHVEGNGVLGSFSQSYDSDDPPDYATLLAAAGFNNVQTDNADWARVTNVELFQVTALDDGVLEDDERLVGGTFEGFEHLKKIEVAIIPRGRESLLGRGRITATILKAF